MLIGVVVVLRRIAEAMERILQSLQTLLDTTTTFLTKTSQPTPPPLPPRTHPQNLLDEEQIERATARRLDEAANGQHLYSAPAGGGWIRKFVGKGPVFNFTHFISLLHLFL